MAQSPTTSSRLPAGAKVRYRYSDPPSTAYGYAWVQDSAIIEGQLVYHLDNGVTVKAEDVTPLREGEE